MGGGGAPDISQDKETHSAVSSTCENSPSGKGCYLKQGICGRSIRAENRFSKEMSPAGIAGIRRTMAPGRGVASARPGRGSVGAWLWPRTAWVRRWGRATAGARSYMDFLHPGDSGFTQRTREFCKKVLEGGEGHGEGTYQV